MQLKYSLSIDDMHCASCIAKIEKALQLVDGTTQAQVDLVHKTALVTGGSPQEAMTQLAHIGYKARLVGDTKTEATVSLSIQNMTCASCIGSIQSALEAIEGVGEIQINLLEKTVSISSAAPLPDVLLVLKRIGYEGVVVSEDQTDAGTTRESLWPYWRRSAVAALVALFFMSLDMFGSGWLSFIKVGADQGPLVVGGNLGLGLCLLGLALATMIYSGRNYYRGALQQLKHRSANMDSLVALGTLAAWFYSCLVILFYHKLPPDMHHLFLDASVMILAFINIGRALEVKVTSSASRAIEKLIHLQAKTAVVIKGSQSIEIPIERLVLGDIVRIYPGSQVPIDGVIVDGQTHINESMLTGEAMPVFKQKGSEVFSGTLNQQGSIDIGVTRLSSQTTLAGMIELVRHAQSSKPAIGRMVDKVASIFVPIVLLIAVLTFVIWCQWSVAHATTAAISVLVIACPCALGLGTPIAMMCGTSLAAKHGILIRNGESLQTASEVTDILLDKTGTITEGKPSINRAHYFQSDQADIDSIAHVVESRSEHPLAKAIVSFTENKAKQHQLTDFVVDSGHGVGALVDKKQVLLGNLAWMQQHSVMIPSSTNSEIEKEADATIIYIAIDGTLSALYFISDPIKEDCAYTMEQLKAQKINLAIISGDHKASVQAVAKKIGIDTVFADQLPAEKLAVIEHLQKKGAKVAMVGDGINDAPALAQAHVGIAMGAGTDIAIESADIMLVGNSPLAIPKAILISKYTMRTIKKALWGAFIYNSVGVVIATGVFYPVWHWLLTPMIASAAMAASSVTVVWVATRLAYVKLPITEK